MPLAMWVADLWWIVSGLWNRSGSPSLRGLSGKERRTEDVLSLSLDGRQTGRQRPAGGEAVRWWWWWVMLNQWEVLGS